MIKILDNRKSIITKKEIEKYKQEAKNINLMYKASHNNYGKKLIKSINN